MAVRRLATTLGEFTALSTADTNSEGSAGVTAEPAPRTEKVARPHTVKTTVRLLATERKERCSLANIRGAPDDSPPTLATITMKTVATKRAVKEANTETVVATVNRNTSETGAVSLVLLLSPASLWAEAGFSFSPSLASPTAPNRYMPQAYRGPSTLTPVNPLASTTVLTVITVSVATVFLPIAPRALRTPSLRETFGPTSKGAR